VGHGLDVLTLSPRKALFGRFRAVRSDIREVTMARSHAARPVAQEQEEARFYPVLLASDARQALAALADVDFRYDALLEKLAVRRHNSQGSPQWARERLLQRQTRERRRWIDRLDQIQARMSDCLGMRTATKMPERRNA
jgi:hypothetical protein